MNKDKEKKSLKKSNKKKRREIVFNRYPAKEKDYFIENISMLLSSGMSIIKTLEIVNSEIKSKYFKKAVDEMLDQVRDGVYLWKALDQHKIFSPYFISLLMIGEESGRLSENFKIIAAQNSKDKIFKAKLKSAMMYPTFVLILAVVIGLGVSWFILPKLATVFTGMNMEMPLITRIMIGAGVFLSNYGSWLVPLIAVVFGISMYFIFVYKKTKHIGQLILFKLPGIKSIIRETEVARFGFILGTMLNAGISIIDSMHSLQQASTFYLYKNFYSHLEKRLNEGQDFQQAFDSYKNSKKLIPSAIQKMISSGQKAGSLAEILLKIDKNMEIKAEITTKNLSVILEPAMLIAIWIGVVTVALAVILPIYSLVGGLNKQQDAITHAPPPPKIKVKKVVSNNKSIKDKTKETNVKKYPKLEILDNSLGYLNVRAEADHSAEIITKIDPGDIYEYVDSSNGWYKIIIGKGYGWVSAKYVKELVYEK